MKKTVLKILSILVIILSFYYFISIFISKNNQFVNYYYYPSSSISESNLNDTFLREISSDLITIQGSEDFKNKVSSEFLIWIDKYKMMKSYGALNLFSSDYIDEDKRILRISYKELNKEVSTNYEELIWVEYNNKLVESLKFTEGQA